MTHRVMSLTSLHIRFARMQAQGSCVAELAASSFCSAHPPCKFVGRRCCLSAPPAVAAGVAAMVCLVQTWKGVTMTAMPFTGVAYTVRPYGHRDWGGQSGIGYLEIAHPFSALPIPQPSVSPFTFSPYRPAQQHMSRGCTPVYTARARGATGSRRIVN